MTVLKRWWFHPAEWWEFWYPQSGVNGGGLGGAIIFVAAFGFMMMIGY